jgi:LacI family transcriptional regulator
MKSNKITIHDIASILKIDSSTISRALNNSPRVAEKTKKKILAKADELGYQRNLLASNLRKNKTQIIGVVVPRISRHFLSSVISGIEEVAYKEGFNVIICQSFDEIEREKNILESLSANRVEGILISISMKTVSPDHFFDLKKRGVPFVFFDRHIEAVDTNKVLLDDFQGGFDATQHLISEGCKEIAHFCGSRNISIYKNRLEGYKAALEKNNLPFNKELVIESGLMEIDGFINTQKLLSLPIKVDGIFFANDVAAIGAMKYLKREGIAIPETIAVVGFGNSPISEVIEPSLTTIEQNGSEMGKIAAGILLGMMNNADVTTQTKFKTIKIHGNLIRRGSSKKSGKTI